MENLIGRKIKGFKFKNKKNCTLSYQPEMNKHIGEVGVIKNYYPNIKAFKVEFEDDYWSYPADQIKKQLMKEDLVDMGYAIKPTELSTKQVKGTKLKEKREYLNDYIFGNGQVSVQGGKHIHKDESVLPFIDLGNLKTSNEIGGDLDINTDVDNNVHLVFMNLEGLDVLQKAIDYIRGVLTNEKIYKHENRK